MKHTILFSSLLFLFAMTGIFSGCKLATEPGKSSPSPQSTNHMIINEVFTLPPAHQGTYSWIELMNPTTEFIKTVDTLIRKPIPQDTTVAADPSVLLRDTVTIRAMYLKFTAEASFENPFSFSPAVSIGEKEMYLPLSIVHIGMMFTPLFLQATGLPDSVVSSDSMLVQITQLAPNGMNVYTNFFSRLDDDTDIGNAAWIVMQAQVVFGFDTLVSINEIFPSAPSKKIYQPYTTFYLPTTGEIQLVEREETFIRSVVATSDPSLPFSLPFNCIDTVLALNETVLDVVRYGNFSTTGVTLKPNNKSAGYIPEFYSLARYAGGYFTDNTKNDFYFESQPVPGWYSTRKK